MTSPREAVSLLTAAALVVAPVGGVAATYTTGYAEDGDSHTTTAEGRTLPKSYDEVLRLIADGAPVNQADLETMATAQSLTQDEYARLCSLMSDGVLKADAAQTARQMLDAMAPVPEPEPEESAEPEESDEQPDSDDPDQLEYHR